MQSHYPTYMGQNHLHFPQLDSTNAWLLNTISKTNPPEGTCVTTDFQTAGRGQIGRSWHSEPGMNFLASFLFFPQNLLAKKQFELSVMVSLAIQNVVAAHCSHVSIKWPNDIYVGNKKIAGILIQNVLRGELVHSAIIGIGLNCNQISFPDELPNPTSLALCSGSPIAMDEIRGQVSASLERAYERWKKGEADQLKSDYHHFLYRRGVYGSYAIGGEAHPKEAKITGVCDDGRLMLTDTGGRLYTGNVKEIIYL